MKERQRGGGRGGRFGGGGGKHAAMKALMRCLCFTREILYFFF